MGELSKFLIKIDNLQQASATKRARFKTSSSLYKPTMLLATVYGVMTERKGYLKPDISFDVVRTDFAEIYRLLVDESRSTESLMAAAATQAYWYLGAGKPRLWSLTPQVNQGRQLRDLIQQSSQIKSPRRLQSIVRSARVPAPIWDMLQDPRNCYTIISFLISRYYPDDITQKQVFATLARRNGL